jgi:multidrug efflux pump subunit AcrB
MRALFGLVSLLMVVAIVGILAKKQLSSVTSGPAAAASSAGVTLPTTTPGATPQQQSQQIQQQVKQSVEATLQQARPVDDTK